MDINKYALYFILGGASTVLGDMIISNYDKGVALSTYMYGGVPTIYMMLLWFAYRDGGKEGYDTFVVHSLVNCGMFYVVLLILFGLTVSGAKQKKSFSIETDLGLALLAFIFMSVLYFKYFFSREFSF